MRISRISNGQPLEKEAKSLEIILNQINPTRRIDTIIQRFAVTHPLYPELVRVREKILKTGEPKQWNKVMKRAEKLLIPHK